jgi:hypothetical protein
MYFRDCKTLSVFERKIPLIFSLEFRFHQDHAGRHLLTFESQKLNYFGKKVGPAI